MEVPMETPVLTLRKARLLAAAAGLLLLFLSVVVYAGPVSTG